MLKDTNFFLLIEDYGYSKSRTKIGVSVDTKVWEKNSDPFTDIWSTHRYLIHSQFHASNKCETDQISEKNTSLQLSNKLTNKRQIYDDLCEI